MYKKIETVLWDKKKPEKTRVVGTTHGRWRTLKFLCPPTTMRCMFNKPFSSKWLTLQGNGKHKQCFICHVLSYSRLRAESETKNMSGRERVNKKTSWPFPYTSRRFCQYWYMILPMPVYNFSQYWYRISECQGWYIFGQVEGVMEVWIKM